jgi:DNA-binding response OmpR family regulator
MDKSHILVVDDQPTMRQMLRLFLETSDYRVSEAKDADEALDKAKTDRPALILLDLKMPGKSGHDVLKALRADQTFKVPVMVLTGQTDWTSVDASIAEGADAYMTKPITREQLLLKVGELLKPRPPD